MSDPAIASGHLRAAASVLGVREVSLLDYQDQRSTWVAYQAAVRTLTSTVDGVERQATPWPDWAITTVIDTRSFWATVWRAVSCHSHKSPRTSG